MTAVTDAAQLASFTARGVDVLPYPASNGHFDLPALWAALGARSIQSLLVECGGGFAHALLAAGVVNKVRLYLAPILLGGDGVSLLAGPGVENVDEAWRFHDIIWRRIGDDFRVDGYT